jgi:outer membrane protein TolC
VELREREAELADLKGGIRFDVSAALLDLKAADAGVQVSDSARSLSKQELDQTQDRFRAGVASTLELVQAQESVASASEAYIASVYAHAVAKGTLARAIGEVEQTFVSLVGGKQ